jgi:uncharacterized membrane protein
VSTIPAFVTVMPGLAPTVIGTCVNIKTAAETITKRALHDAIILLQYCLYAILFSLPIVIIIVTFISYLIIHSLSDVDEGWVCANHLFYPNPHQLLY